MLLNLSITNFLSFKEEFNLSFSDIDVNDSTRNHLVKLCNKDIKFN